MSVIALTMADYVIAGIIIFSVLVSLIRGFVREALSLATWVLAVWVALTFYRDVAKLLSLYITTPSVQLITGFLLLFILSLVVGAIANFIITQVVQKTGLTGTDRLLGVIFGLGRGILLVAVLLLLARLTPLTADPWWHKSLLIPRFHSLEAWLHSLLPASVGFSIPDEEPKK